MQRSGPYVFIVLAMALLYLSGTMINKSFNLSVSKSDLHKESFLILLSSTSRKMDSALALNSQPEKVFYSGVFESPFRVYVSTPVRNVSKQTVPIDRKKLFLKGILFKGSPQAILEDEKGVTYIRGVGDTALGQRVEKIKENGVTLRDKQGPYEITVEDK